MVWRAFYDDKFIHSLHAEASGEVIVFGGTLWGGGGEAFLLTMLIRKFFLKLYQLSHILASAILAALYNFGVSG